MKRIEILDPCDPHNKDKKRIQKIFFQRGYLISLGQAETLWRIYSSGLAAEWMYLPPSDDRVFELLKDFFKEYE